MTWPTPQDFNEAIQSPYICFNDPELQAGKVELNPLGLPKGASGAFASVYKVTAAGVPWAVRCFLRFLPEQAQRYKKVSDFVLFDDLACTVDFHFLEKGISIKGGWYPILKMRWVDGDTLDQHITKHYKDEERMAALAASFFDLIMELENADIAHGDLQHGNILVSPDGLRLVDYDGLFVPALAGERSLEFGHPNYQHPMRSQNHFDPSVDNFSSWLIHTSILALRTEPDLYTKFLGGDDCILFKRKDLLAPDTSELFKTLVDHESNELSNTARLLMRMLYVPPHLVPPIHATEQQLKALPEATPQFPPYDQSAEMGLPEVNPAGMPAPDYDIAQVLRATVAEDEKQRKVRLRRKKFRLKAATASLTQSVQNKVLKTVDTTLRKAHPDTWTTVNLQKGDRHFDRSEYEKAAEAYVSVQSHRETFLSLTEQIDLQLRLGRTFGMMGNYSMAANYFLLASRAADYKNHTQRNLTARFLLAMARHQAGRKKEAYEIIGSIYDLNIYIGKILEQETRFKYVRSSASLQLLESYANEYTHRGDLKKAVEILEVGRELCVNTKHPASRDFRDSYLDLLIRLGCTYVRMGFLSYANGIAIDANRVCQTAGVSSLTDLRVALFAACIFLKREPNGKLYLSSPPHPTLKKLTQALTRRNSEDCRTAVKSFYDDFGQNGTLSLLADAAALLWDQHNREKAIDTITLAWRLLIKDWNGSMVEKLRWLRLVQAELIWHCLDEESTKLVVEFVARDINNNRTLHGTELILSALYRLGKPADAATIAVLDEMIYLVRKSEHLFSVQEKTQAKSLVQQYDRSRTRIHKLDDVS